MRGYDVIFDRENDQVGFAAANCDWLTVDTVKNFTQLATPVVNTVKQVEKSRHTIVIYAFYICLGVSVLLLLCLLGYIIYTCISNASQKYITLNKVDQSVDYDSENSEVIVSNN